MFLRSDRRNISALAAHMGLGKNEEKIFALAIRAARSGPVKSLCSALTDEARIPVEDAVVHLTGLAPAQVRYASELLGDSEYLGRFERWS